MSKGRRKKSSFETSAEPRVNAQRFENIQAAMKESIDSIEVDSKRREIFRDAVNQSDTVYELGLLATLPGLRIQPHRSTLIALLGHKAGRKASLIIIMTRLSVAKDMALWSISGGIGDGNQWIAIPHSVGRCEQRNGGLVWLDGSTTDQRKFGILHSFRFGEGHIDLEYTSYHGKRVRIKASIDDRRATGRLSIDGRRPIGGLTVFCEQTVWNEEVSAGSELFHGWSWLHSVRLEQWIKLRLRLRDDKWLVLKSNVIGPVLEGEALGAIQSSCLRCSTGDDIRNISIRVLKTRAAISDTSGRNMFFPSELEVEFGDEKRWVVKADLDGVVYGANGTMNWLCPAHVYEEDKPLNECIIEAYQLQSIDEVIGTTLQLAGFVDRLDDDTSNDWALFRP